jgi:long-chain acyl-CoA synthetase
MARQPLSGKQDMTDLGERVLAALRLPSVRVEGPAGAGLGSRNLAEASQALAARLQQGGVEPKEPVMLAVANEPGDLVGFLGVWLAGCVAVPVHAASLQHTVDALATKTGARWVVCGGQLQRLADASPPLRPQLTSAALIIFTSGSTGTPKGVVIGHDGLSLKLDVLSRILPVGPSDVVLMPLQLTFIFGIWVSLLTLLRGGRLLLAPKFSRDLVSGPLQAASVLAAVPTMLRVLDAMPVYAPHLAVILTGGEPLAPVLAASLAGKFPRAAVFDLYGSTETGSCDFCLRSNDQPAGWGSIGHPTDGVTYRLTPQSGHEGQNAVCELQIKTPARMLGYLDEPQMTAEAFDDGFFRTGDLARSRLDGRVELIGRAKEIISRGGNKISPIEIDNMLLKHPDVAAAISVGIPDPHLGETLHVLVVARDGHALDGYALRAWAATKVEKFKLPDRIHVSASLPVGKTGKSSRADAATVVHHLIAAEKAEFERPS